MKRRLTTEAQRHRENKEAFRCQKQIMNDFCEDLKANVLKLSIEIVPLSVPLCLCG